MNAPCKGTNCGSTNGWLHSRECFAEHDALCDQAASTPVGEVPAGWVMIPAKPTDAMLEALRGHPVMAVAYVDMLAASPATAASKVGILEQAYESMLGKPVTLPPSEPEAQKAVLPLMRSAFRTTEVHGASSILDQRFRMVFNFPNIGALHAADDEWNCLIGLPSPFSSSPSAASYTSAGEATETIPADASCEALWRTLKRAVQCLDELSYGDHINEDWWDSLQRNYSKELHASLASPSPAASTDAPR